MCEQFLIDQIDFAPTSQSTFLNNRIPEYYELAEQYNAPRLADNCIHYGTLTVNARTLNRHLKVAEKSKSEELFKKCEDFACTNVDFDTIVEYLGFGIQYNFGNLSKKCYEFGGSIIYLKEAINRFVSAKEEHLLKVFRQDCQEEFYGRVTVNSIESECSILMLISPISVYMEIAERYDFQELGAYCLEFPYKDISPKTLERYLELAKRVDWVDYDAYVKAAVKDVNKENFPDYVGVANKFGLVELRNKCMDVMFSL
jgi:hypothetical protein